MKKVLLIYAILIAGIFIWYYGVGREKKFLDGSKGVALKVSKHSVQFNESMEKIMESYYKMTDNFVGGDTISISKQAYSLKSALDSLKLEELQRDTSIYQTAAIFWDNAKTEITGMITDPSLQAKRESLNLLSNELFTLLLTIHYDLAKLYWQECPSAFGEDTPGNWISQDEKSKNPYGSEDCATVRKVINFVAADSSRRPSNPATPD